MKKFGQFVLLIMVLLTASACSEDKDLESLQSLTNADNLRLWQDTELPATTLQLTPRFIKVGEGILDTIITFMGNEHEFYMELGRKILRERGGDPATAFSGGINDARLALIPKAAKALDSIGFVLYNQGYQIDSVYVQRNSSSNGNSLSVTQEATADWKEDLYQCAGSEGGILALGISALTSWSGWTGVSATSLISWVGGATILTVGEAAAVAATAWLLYRITLCMEQKRLGRANITCAITVKADIDCAEMVRNGRENAGIYNQCGSHNDFCSDVYSQCEKEMEKKILSKMSILELRYGDTLLNVVKQERFLLNNKIYGK